MNHFPDRLGKFVELKKNPVASESVLFLRMTDKIKSGLEALTQSSMKLGEAMYKSQQQDAPNPNESSDNTAGESDLFLRMTDKLLADFLEMRQNLNKSHIELELEFLL